MKRSPLKRGKKALKKRSPEAKERLRERKDRAEKLHDFFLSIWLSLMPMERSCQSCFKPLSDPPRDYYFDHLLEKSKYPALAFEKDNIFLCCLVCHSLKTDGSPTILHKRAIEKAKVRFGID